MLAVRDSVDDEGKPVLPQLDARCRLSLEAPGKYAFTAFARLLHTAFTPASPHCRPKQ
jgi:hypothetical protein